MPASLNNQYHTTSNVGESDETQDVASKISPRSLFTFTTRKDLVILLPALFLVTISGAAKPLISVFIGKIYDQLGRYESGITTSPELVYSAKRWCLALMVLGLATIFLNGISYALWLSFGDQQARAIREELFLSMTTKDMEWFDSRSDGVPSFLTRIQTQIRELQAASSQISAFFCEDMATFIGALGIAFYSSWKLTLVVISSIPIIGAATWFVTRKLSAAIEDQKMKLGYASKIIATTIPNIDTVKAFNAEDQIASQYSESIKEQAQSYLWQAWINAMQIGITKSGTVATFALSFWYARILVIHGMGVGTVVTTIYACVMAAEAATAILPQVLILAKGMSAGIALKGIMNQLESGNSINGRFGAARPRVCNGEVEVRRLNFAYPMNPDKLVFKDINLYFPAKRMVFVIGKSGSGKSTLSNLLIKFYKPLAGEILIDGFPLEKLDNSWLRKNITLVQQQSTLFNDTLYMNIAFGRKLDRIVVEEDVLSACQTAMLQQTINGLSQGLETMVGSGGNSMSGGQRQRVAIARARLRDSPILILDEATSALDQSSRALVMEAIREWRKEKTTIIVTHDITQALSEDYVYVFDDGKVVQQGYSGFIKTEGPFHDLLSKSDLTPTNPFDDAAEISETRSSSPVSNCSMASVETSASNDSVGHQTSQGYLSRLVGLSTGLESSRPRSSLGFGLGVVHAKNLRAQNIWATRDEKVPGFLRRPGTPATHLSMSQPSEPDRKVISRAFRSINPEETEDGFELSELQDQGSQPNRASGFSTSRPERGLSRQYSGASSDTRPFVTKADLDCLRGQSILPTTTPQIHNVELKQILGTVLSTLERRDKMLCTVAILCVSIGAACTPAFAYSFSHLLSSFNVADEKSSTHEATKWTLLILAIAATDGASSLWYHYLFECVGTVWITYLRMTAFKRVLLQPKSWFAKHSSSPEKICYTLDRDAEEMRNLVGRFAAVVYYVVFMMSFAVIWAFAVCWKLTIIGLTSSPVIFILSRASQGVYSKWENRINSCADRISSVFAETFGNIRVVRVYNVETYFIGKLQCRMVDMYRVSKQRAIWTGIFFGLNDCTTYLVAALILYSSCVIATSDSELWSVKDVVTVSTLLLFSASAAASVIQLIPQIGQSRASGTAILHITNLPRHASHEYQGTKKILSPFPVELRNLNFSFPATKNHPAAKILHDINMSFEANASTALVGPSGCGKSTIASILLNLLPPDEPIQSFRIPNSSRDESGTLIRAHIPTLTFAGISEKYLHSPTLRGYIALVPQSPVLFPTTIAENISYGLPTSSPLRTRLNVICAAQAAGIHDIISSMPDGYETQIGDGGQGLSGGQSQRICIARALIRRPKILILDEATSALDAESAKEIRDLVSGLIMRGNGARRRSDSVDGKNEVADGMAVIVITHAVEMMRICDKVIMMEGGRVTEQGTFNDLVARKGKFARLIGSRRAN